MKANLNPPRNVRNALAGKKMILFVGACLSLALFVFPAPFAEGKEGELFLLHTNNVTGHFFPCPT